MFGTRSYREAVVVVGDVILLYAGLWLALSLRHWAPADLLLISKYLPSFSVLFLAWMVVFYVFGLYDLKRLRSLRELLRGIIGAGAVNMIGSVFFFYIFYTNAPVGITPKTNLFLVLGISHLGVFLWRRMAFGLLSLRKFQRSVVVLADRGLVKEVREELARHPQLGYRVMPWSWPGTDAMIADEGWTDRHWQLAKGPLEEAHKHWVEIMSLSSFYEKILGKVPLEHAVRTRWVKNPVYWNPDGWYMPAKRFMDIVLAFVLLVVLSPLIGLTVVLVRVVDGQPILCGQRRVGRIGRKFVMWKIRTMRTGSESTGPFVRALARKDMATPLGRWLRRFRLDELPQLWNVLKGDMSLVGPRPEMPDEVAVLERKIPHYDIRHLVRPGITGWAQLNFRATNNPRDLQEKLQYDLYYIKYRSLELDLAIVLRSIQRIFFLDSASHSRSV